jgi:hypothetical protein
VWTSLPITLRTSERGGEGDCVKEGGGEGERERERALGLLLCHNPVHRAVALLVTGRNTVVITTRNHDLLFLREIVVVYYCST